ncbi:His-Xaa-Ser system radical SAM maturase HxsB [Novosphingobium sp. Gsoil 351]|uniref:His-Xaa-Ser system radical SAM maturase HxsB n=1 Tax=Novosphingobium sp. Gsoil 351 TaxID=2675225 RepID=UPI001E3311F8|nr:His-Xaa-Ser system radical SAM maturase HxsB [Novosphingobium sp. Gsoil 351]
MAPLKLRARRDGDVLCVSSSGDFFQASADFAVRLATDALTTGDASQLQRWGLMAAADLDWNLQGLKLARRMSVVRELDYLILVPTLRCNLSCSYCQVSRVNETQVGFDWSEETLAGVLALIDSLPSDQIKVEFQGGEPTLRPDLIEAVIARCARFTHAEFVVCTNLQSLSDVAIALFDRSDVFISTSLDGSAATHRRQRTATDEANTQFHENLRFLVDRYGPGKISALPTIDPANPPDPDDLIGAYSSLGLASIFLRPINFQGFARKRHAGSKSLPRTWSDYHERFVRRMIARNWDDRTRVLEETYLSICLRRIFQPGAERHVDLRNPNPMGIDYLVVDHDGTFYPTDEARMLARSGVIDLSIGSISAGIDLEKRALLNRHATNSFDPDCIRCAYQPFCGRDVVDDLSRYGTIDVRRLNTEFCRRHRDIFDFAFELIYSEDEATRYSLCRWLGLSGEIPLGEVLQ